MSTQRERGTHVQMRDLAIVVIGKTGNGKSSLCNTILGVTTMIFATGRSMTSTTKETKVERTERDGYRLTVVDTPDVTNLEWMRGQMQLEVQKWRTTITGLPYAVLLVVRCDVRYTAEEYQVYREFLRLWGDNSVKSRLVVAFTFGNRQGRDIAEELKTVCPELQKVLSDARLRYVVFNNEDTAEQKAGKVRELLTIVEFMKDETVFWSRKVISVIILLLVAGVLFTVGVTVKIPALAAVFGVAYFVILVVIVWQKCQLTSVIRSLTGL